MNKLNNRFLNKSPHVMSVCLPTHPPSHLPTYLFTYPSINLSMYIHPSIHSPIHPFIHLSKSILHSGNVIYSLSSYLLSKNVKINIFITQNTFQNSITRMSHAVKTV